MAEHSLTCPECSHEFALETRPGRGKRVKCPECGQAFFPDVDDADDETARVQNRPAVKKAETSGEVEEEFVPRIKKKKPKRKSSMAMYVVAFLAFFLLGTGLLSCCVLAGVGAFLWPGFLLQKNELIVFAPPEANLIAGGSPKQLNERFAHLNDVIGPNPMMLNNQPELVNLIKESERVIFCLNTEGVGFGQKIHAVVALKAKRDVVDRFRNSPVIGESRLVKGHTIHLLKGVGPGQSFVAFPSNEIVVIADFSDELLATSLGSAKIGGSKSTALDLAKSVDTTSLWIAYAFDGKAKQNMKELFEKGGQGSPAMRDAAPAIGNVRGMTLSVDVAKPKQIQLVFALHCRTSEDAVKVKAGAEDGWDTLKGLMRAGMMFGAAPANQGRALELMMRDLNTMTFSQRKDLAHAKVTFADETLEELARLGKNMNPFMAPMPPPQMPPPGVKGAFLPERAINIGDVGARFSQNGNLLMNDPRSEQGKLHKLYAVRLEAKRFYQIDLMSQQFDAYLYLLDDKGRILARDDDGGDNLNSRIHFIAPQAGIYYIQATSLVGNQVGAYTLTVQRNC